MTFGAFRSADVFDRYRIPFTAIQFIRKPGVKGIEFISLMMVSAIGKIHAGSAVAIDAPAHAQRRELVDLIHFLNGPMAGLALDMARIYMLGVAEEDEVGQVMDLYPFYRVPRACISAFCGVIAGIREQLLDLLVRIDLRAVGTGEPFSMIGSDGRMAIHAKIEGRNGCLFAVPGVPVTKQTADLIQPGVDAMRKEDRLPRLIALLAAETDPRLGKPPAEEEHDEERSGGDIDFIAVERDVIRRGETALFVGQSFQITIDQIQPKDKKGKDKGANAIQHRMIFLSNGRIVGCIGARIAANGLGIRLHIIEDGVDLRVSQVGEDVHGRAPVLVEQVVEVGVPRMKDDRVVVDPLMKQVSVGYPFGNTFQRRTNDNTDRVVALRAIGLKKGFAVELMSLRVGLGLSLGPGLSCRQQEKPKDQQDIDRSG